jgi:hypothetical protein
VGKLSSNEVNLQSRTDCTGQRSGLGTGEPVIQTGLQGLWPSGIVWNSEDWKQARDVLPPSGEDILLGILERGNIAG